MGPRGRRPWKLNEKPLGPVRREDKCRKRREAKLAVTPSSTPTPSPPSHPTHLPRTQRKRRVSGQERSIRGVERSNVPREAQSSQVARQPSFITNTLLSSDYMIQNAPLLTGSPPIPGSPSGIMTLPYPLLPSLLPAPAHPQPSSQPISDPAPSELGMLSSFNNLVITTPIHNTTTAQPLTQSFSGEADYTLSTPPNDSSFQTSPPVSFPSEVDYNLPILPDTTAFEDLLVQIGYTLPTPLGSSTAVLNSTQYLPDGVDYNITALTIPQYFNAEIPMVQPEFVSPMVSWPLDIPGYPAPTNTMAAPTDAELLALMDLLMHPPSTVSMSDIDFSNHDATWGPK